MLSLVSAATLPGTPTTPNEDWLASGNEWAIVLDGVTRPPGDGCIHSVPFFTTGLGNALAKGLISTQHGLRAILADAIEHVRTLHGDACDLENPLSPAAQVSIIRSHEEHVEYLVLGDCTVAWKLENEAPVAVCDDRADHLPNPPEPAVVNGIRRYPLAYVASVRNQPGGFYVASTDPSAANQALTGSIPTNRLEYLALFSDGATRLVERYGWTWTDMLSLGTARGVPWLLEQVREAELRDDRLHARGKTHDDATGIMLSSSN